jgi:hypothetical protein
MDCKVLPRPISSAKILEKGKSRGEGGVWGRRSGRHGGRGVKRLDRDEGVKENKSMSARNTSSSKQL